MKFVKQDNTTRSCGQIALAAIFDLTKEQAYDLVGHSHGTKTVELCQAIRKKGWLCPDRLVVTRAGWKCWRALGLNQTAAICKLVYPGDPGWHWAAVDRNGVWYDGDRLNEPVTTDQMILLYGGAYRVTSYLPVSEPKKLKLIGA